MRRKKDAYTLVLGSFWSWTGREPLVLLRLESAMEKVEAWPTLLKDMVMWVGCRNV